MNSPLTFSCPWVNISVYIDIFKEIGINLAIFTLKKVFFTLLKKPEYTPCKKFGAILPYRLGPCVSLMFSDDQSLVTCSN